MHLIRYAHMTENIVTNRQKFLLSICTEPSLKTLLNELHPVRASWYKIGLQLDIPHATLDCFKQNYSDQTDLMCEMLKEWLKTAVDPPPSWEVVVTALRSPAVNEMSVAAQLEAKYCAQVQHVRDECKVEKTEGNVSSLITGVIICHKSILCI